MDKAVIFNGCDSIPSQPPCDGYEKTPKCAAYVQSANNKEIRR
jgi:hypothetical protein